MDEQELAGFIIHDELAWRIWMNGCDIGLAHGHQDERAGMEELAELVARRQLVLEYCQDQIRAQRANTLSMTEVRKARNRTRIGNYTSGPVPWEKDGHE